MASVKFHTKSESHQAFFRLNEYKNCKDLSSCLCFHRSETSMRSEIKVKIMVYNSLVPCTYQQNNQIH